jgi:uncharacterized membrane protein
MKHLDKPKHQRWLYILSDMGLFKAILIIWMICFLAIGVAMGLAKAIISFFK